MSSCDLCTIIGETVLLLEPDLRKQGVKCECRIPRSVILTADLEQYQLNRDDAHTQWMESGCPQ